jgi:hypothetical protein
MDPKHYLFVDERTQGACVFCGDIPDTLDHVPSKVFLESPFPKQLVVVKACRKCNQSFSLDEEYLACLLEVVLVGSTDPTKIKRSKIKRAISRRNARLQTLLAACAHIDESGRTVWIPDVKRVRNVVLKLAQGHLAYELGFSQLEEPASVKFRPLLSMSLEDREQFERAGSGKMAAWPEVNSRALIRAIGAEP